MHSSNVRVIPKDLQPVCDSILKDSLFSFAANEAYISAFRKKFYDGENTVKMSLSNYYSERHLNRIFPYMVFLVLVFALKRIQVLELNKK